MHDKKLPPLAYLELAYGDETVRIPLPGLLGTMKDVLPAGTPDTVRLGVDRDSTAMFAEICPREAEYPGITVDACSGAMPEIWLGRFELPCETYPTRIGARLYAGCSRYETDGPIALVTHDVDNTKRGLARAAMRESDHGGARKMTKLVYVDEDLARSRTWHCSSQDGLPEHKEDE